MRFLLSFLMLVLSSQAFSQRLYFIYLQAEADQPFFVRINDKVHSSGPTGWLLLSRLKDSSYQFSVGFPANKWPEQRFSVSIKTRDHGYLLRNFGDKGWGLYDLQTSAVIMAEQVNTGSSGIRPEAGPVSPFTEILARAADDPSLRYRPVLARQEEKQLAVQPAVVQEEVKPITTTAPPPKEDPPVANTAPVASVPDESRIRMRERLVVTQENPPVARMEVAVASEQAKESDPEPDKPNRDSSVATAATIKVEEEKAVVTSNDASEKSKRNDSAFEPTKPEVIPVKEEVKPPVAEYKMSIVTKKSESSTSEGFGLTFIDDLGGGNRDTIRIIIPNPRRSFVNGNGNGQAKEDPRFLDIAAGENNKAVVEKPSAEQSTVTSATTNLPDAKAVAVKKCRSVATENDFLKLRRKMAAENGDDDMISEATKAFKVNCFATVQLKYLSALFLNDHGKFKFFQAAQPIVSDPENFHALSAELKEEYYITRFKTM